MLVPFVCEWRPWESVASRKVASDSSASRAALKSALLLLSAGYDSSASAPLSPVSGNTYPSRAASGVPGFGIGISRRLGPPHYSMTIRTSSPWSETSRIGPVMPLWIASTMRDLWSGERPGTWSIAKPAAASGIWMFTTGRPCSATKTRIRRPARASCAERRRPSPLALELGAESGNPPVDRRPSGCAFSSSAATIGAASCAVSRPSETSFRSASSSPDIALPPRPIEALGGFVDADLSSLEGLQNRQFILLGEIALRLGRLFGVPTLAGLGRSGFLRLGRRLVRRRRRGRRGGSRRLGLRACGYGRAGCRDRPVLRPRGQQM